MTDTIAEIGPLLMGCGIGWLIFCIISIVLTGMIFDEDMRREDMWRKQSGVSTETAQRLIPGRDERGPEDTNERGES